MSINISTPELKASVQKAGQEPVEFTFTEGDTIQSAKDALSALPQYAGTNKWNLERDGEMLIIGTDVEADELLEEGDVLVVTPKVEGGN